MRRSLAICVVMIAWAAAQEAALAAEKGSSKSPENPPISVRHAYVDAYAKSQLPAQTAVPAVPLVDPEAALTPLQQRLEAAGAWLDLMEPGDEADHWEVSDCSSQDPLRPASRLCGLRWRKTDGLTGIRGQLDEISTGMKAKFVGKALADNLEVDIDSSPEIKFKFDWK
ncbi:MAG: hypothetical protein AAGE01_10535 [Pseudomonadota bacterium]